MEQLGPAQVVNLADAEDNPHGIPGRHCGQEGLVPGDQVAHRHFFLADGAGDGGADFSEFQVQFGLGDGGPGLINGSPAVLDGRFGVVQVHLGGSVFDNERSQTCHVLLGLFQGGLGLGQTAPGFLQGRFIGPLVDNKQELSDFDLAAFPEENLFQEACHPGPYLHGLAGLGPGHVFPVNRDGARGHRCYHHCRRGEAPGGFGLIPGTTSGDQKQKNAKTYLNRLVETRVARVSGLTHGKPFRVAKPPGRMD